MGLQVPSLDGMGTNYGASDWTLYEKMNFVFNLNKWYADLATSNSNVSFVNIAGQFDTEYNMPSSVVPVNTRSATTETRQTNGVHPAMNGYYQIADAAYRDIHNKLQEV